METAEKLIAEAEATAEVVLLDTPAAPPVPSFLSATSGTSNEEERHALIDFAADTSDALHTDESHAPIAGTPETPAPSLAAPVAGVGNESSPPHLSSVPLPPALATAADAKFVAPFEASGDGLVPTAPSPPPSFIAPATFPASHASSNLTENDIAELNELRSQFALGIERLDAILARAHDVDTNKE
jgi:hypothetical protein